MSGGLRTFLSDKGVITGVEIDVSVLMGVEELEVKEDGGTM